MTYPEHVPQFLIIHEPNYTQVPNELLDGLKNLEPAEALVAVVICRQTFGWHKERDVISLTQMEEKTSMSRKTIVKAVSGLVDKGVIEKTPTKDGSAYRLLVEKFHPTSGKSTPDASGEIPHTKETITKDSTYIYNRTTFQKPTIEAVSLQCAKIGLPESEAESFLNYYEANGWKVGKNKMVSWPHALSNWKKNWSSRQILLPQIQKTLEDKTFDEMMRKASRL